MYRKPTLWEAILLTVVLSLAIFAWCGCGADGDSTTSRLDDDTADDDAIDDDAADDDIDDDDSNISAMEKYAESQLRQTKEYNCGSYCEHIERCDIDDPNCYESCFEHYDRNDWQKMIRCNFLFSDCINFLDCVPGSYF